LTAPFVTSKAAITEFLKKEGGKGPGEGFDVGKIKERGVILNIISSAGIRGYRAGSSDSFSSSTAHRI
jgi:hypothetical protein